MGEQRAGQNVSVLDQLQVAKAAGEGGAGGGKIAATIPPLPLHPDPQEPVYQETCYL